MKRFILCGFIGLTFVSFSQNDSIVKAKVISENQGYELSYNEGVKKFQANDFEGALKDLNESIRLKADVERTHFYKGVSLFNLNDFANAFVSLNQAIQLSFNEANAGIMVEKSEEKTQKYWV